MTEPKSHSASLSLCHTLPKSLSTLAPCLSLPSLHKTVVSMVWFFTIRRNQLTSHRINALDRLVMATPGAGRSDLAWWLHRPGWSLDGPPGRLRWDAKNQVKLSYSLSQLKERWGNEDPSEPAELDAPLARAPDGGPLRAAGVSFAVTLQRSFSNHPCPQLRPRRAKQNNGPHAGGQGDKNSAHPIETLLHAYQLNRLPPPDFLTAWSVQSAR